MKSLTTKKFWASFNQLPDEIKERAVNAFHLFKENPNHPGLRLKKISDNPVVYSARVTKSHRALGVKEKNTMIWFWIGSHDEYERMIK